MSNKLSHTPTPIESQLCATPRLLTPNSTSSKLKESLSSWRLNSEVLIQAGLRQQQLTTIEYRYQKLPIFNCCQLNLNFAKRGFDKLWAYIGTQQVGECGRKFVFFCIIIRYMYMV